MATVEEIQLYQQEQANVGGTAPLGRVERRNTQLKNKVLEDTLAPLIEQVVCASKPSRGCTKRPQNVSKLVQLVDKATRNFIAVGEEIASENPDFQEELLLACDEVRSAGEAMNTAASQFALDTSQPNRRAMMVHSARELLMSVVRLIVVADEVDMNNLVQASSKIEQKLKDLHFVASEDELKIKITECASDISYITQIATLRQKEFKCEASIQVLAAAQTELNQASRMLTSVSKAFLQCPTSESAKANQEYVIIRMLDALRTLSLLAHGEDPDDINSGNSNPSIAVTARAFTEFDLALDQGVQCSSQEALTSSRLMVSSTLQEATQNILSAASEMATSELTRDYRQRLIVSLSGKLEDGVQQFLLILNGDTESMEGEEHRTRMIAEQARNLKKQKVHLHKKLRQAIVDHISDTCVNAMSPLSLLFEAAGVGDKVLMENRVHTFMNHADNMKKVAELACTFCDDLEGIRMVRVSVKYVHTLSPQVMSAANTLYNEPRNSVVQKSASVFKEAWAENVTLLIDSVFATSSTLDFVSVLEKHVIEDAHEFLQSVEHCSSEEIRDAVGLVRGRCRCLLHFIKVEFKENLSHYSVEQRKYISDMMRRLKEKSLLWLSELASTAASTLESTHDPRKVNGKALEEAMQTVLDQIRNICQVVVQDEPETDEDEEPSQNARLPMSQPPPMKDNASEVSPSSRKFQRTPRSSMAPSSSETLTKEVVSQLSREQKAQLVKAVQDLNAQQEIFEVEVSKWDENSNDIVSLAKEMSIMMADMSDFTSGTGPLNSVTDVIITARDIARAAEYLNKSVVDIANECPDEVCRKDVLAYLERVRLYCHQLKITSAVQADLSTSTKETVDNASSLIITSKNLMTAVVDTVKASYVASTAISRAHGGTMPEQFVQWRLTMPRKKKLFRSDSSDSFGSPSGNQGVPPLHQLGLFRQGEKDKQSLHTLPEHESS